MPASPNQQVKQPNITRELYSKNVELVNANKSLELLSDLYQFIIQNDTLEAIGQQFIDKIVSELAFTDGLIAFKTDNTSFLKLIGVTNTQVNNTLIEISGLSNAVLNIPLERYENLLVSAYRTSKDLSTLNTTDLWTPLIKPSDLAGTDIASRKSFAFAIRFAENTIAVMSLTLDPKVSDLTIFEKELIERVRPLLGIAIDRVNTAIRLKTTQARELEKAHELVKLKDEFVFIATHDLRTPVTAIKGFSDLMKTEMAKLTPDMQENVNAILESTDRLDQLVEDLLEVARSESGTIQIEVVPVDINKIIGDTLTAVKTEAAKRNIALNSNLASTGTVMADPGKLSEVIENLLSNAVKYNRDNGAVSVITALKEANLIVTVSDTGIGIPLQKQSQVFQKFFRAKQVGTETIPGTGLGLFVVRMLVEKMGGQIGFASTEGKGTSFTISLPLAQQPLANQPQKM